MEATPIPTDLSTDLDIEAAVTRAVLELDALRPTPSEVNVRVANGQVTLTGIVPSPMLAAEAERVARHLPGVVGVKNELLDDGTLTLRVAQALATDPRTRNIPPGYRVMSVFGRVTVVGRFADEGTQAALVEVCQSVSGVRGAKIVSTG
jgi:osmotically-inducible protein OsmY